MATQTIEFPAPTGLSLTVELFSYGSDTIVDTESATEGTNRDGIYSADFTDQVGEFRFIAFDGSDPVYTDMIDTQSATGTYLGRKEKRSVTVLAGAGLPINRTTGSVITTFINEELTITRSVNDANGDAISLTGLTLNWAIDESDGTHIADLTPTNISGNSYDVKLTLPVVSGVTTQSHIWALRDQTAGDEVVLDYGTLDVRITGKTGA